MNWISRISVFVVLLLCTSCFELVEEVVLNKDGSGTFEFTANLSQSKTKLKSIMLMEKVNGYRVPTKAEIIKEIDQIVALAKQTKGISNVKRTVDFENFIFSFSCSFTEVEALNKVVKNFRLSKKVANSSHDKQFSYDKKTNTFTRNFDAALQAEYAKLKPEDQNIFKDATSVSIYRFEREVAGSSNSVTKVSPNKKATMLKVKVLDLINKKSTLKNTIKLN